MGNQIKLSNVSPRVRNALIVHEFHHVLLGGEIMPEGWLPIAVAERLEAVLGKALGNVDKLLKGEAVHYRRTCAWYYKKLQEE